MKIRNSVVATVCVLVGALGLTACSDDERSSAVGPQSAGAGQSQAGAAPADAAAGCGDLTAAYPTIKGRNLNVGSSPGQNFYDYVDEKDPSNVIGLEPDLVRAVAQCGGFQVTYQKSDFNGLVPALAAKRLDLITSGMYATPERAKQVNFVTYMKAAEAAVVQTGNPKKVTGLDTLCGTTIAQVTGTVEVEIAAKADKDCQAAGKPAIQFLNFTQQPQLTQALSQGRADVFLTDSGVAAYLSKQFAGSLETAFPIVSDFTFGIAVAKSDTDLLNAINEGLTRLHASGQLAATATKWGFSADQVIQPKIVTS